MSSEESAIESQRDRPAAEPVQQAESDAVAVVNQIASRHGTEYFLRVVDAHFGRDISDHTYEDFTRACGFLGHYAIAGLVAWAADTGFESFSEQVPDIGLTPEAAEMLANVVALYGARIREAFYRTGRNGPLKDDWRAIDREVVRDVEGDDYLVTVKITKKNLDTFTVSGRPTSMLRWAREMLEVLTAVGDRDAFLEHDRDRFIIELENARALLAPDAVGDRTSTRG